MRKHSCSRSASIAFEVDWVIEMNNNDCFFFAILTFITYEHMMARNGVYLKKKKKNSPPVMLCSFEANRQPIIIGAKTNYPFAFFYCLADRDFLVSFFAVPIHLYFELCLKKNHKLIRSKTLQLVDIDFQLSLSVVS